MEIEYRRIGIDRKWIIYKLIIKFNCNFVFGKTSSSNFVLIIYIDKKLSSEKSSTMFVDDPRNNSTRKRKNVW